MKDKYTFDSIVDGIIEEPENSAAILSTLDHWLTEMKKEDRLEYLKKKPKNFDAMNQDCKSFLAGVTEYAYSLCNKYPPEWVESSDYVLSNVRDSKVAANYIKLFDACNDKISNEELEAMMQEALEESLEPMKKRNQICSSLFDSY